MKILIKLGLVFASVGAISTTTFGLLARENLKEATELVQKSYTYEKDEFTAINLLFVNNPISLLKSEDDKVSITFKHDKNETITEEIIDGALNIKVNEKWYQGFFFSFSVFNFASVFQDRTVYVNLPAELYNVHATTENGSITVRDINLNNLTLKTSNGEVDLEKLNATNIVATTSNGDVDLKTVNATSIDLETSNGRIVLDTVNSPTIKATTSNGSISALNMTSNDLQLFTSNGNINAKINGVFADYRVRVSTSIGRIKINTESYTNDTYHSDKIPYVSARTSNGDVTLEFLLG